MEITGNLIKMRTDLSNPVSYSLKLNGELVPMNSLIGKAITLKFEGTIYCIHCGKKTKRSFNQGFCYSCLQTAPEADESVIRPELSRVHLGIARDLEWSKQHDLIDHFVYLAVASDVKVGVTRHHQVPTRWIDQGASYAIKLAKAPNRHIAGVIEVYLKQFVTDKTNWRKMLKNEVNQTIDLPAEKERLSVLLPKELQQYISHDHTVTRLDYPVEQYPDKITSLSLDKQPQVSGVLQGIKGQYLLFDNGRVFNIRKHNGYQVTLSYDE